MPKREKHRPRVVAAVAGTVLVLGTGLVLVPKFYPQQRLTRWKRELGFTFPPLPTSHMNRVLNVILTHQSRSDVERLLAWWSHCSAPGNILLAYGGTEEEFKKLPDIPRIFVADPRLRVKGDLARGKQSYGGVWRAVANRLAGEPNPDWTHIYFAEYDHLPLVSDLSERLLRRMEEERADVLAHRLLRVDGSSFEICLNHIGDPAFAAFWRRISVRANKDVVLYMLGTGSFWTCEAFLAVASQPEQISAFLEIYLPTLAHHLGFRVRDFNDQNLCCRANPIPEISSAAAARARGCWTMHPLKKIPDSLNS